jgi:hypothetical protein
MKILWIVVLFGFLAAAVEAKRKRKFEGDFEFAEEVRLTACYHSYENGVLFMNFIVLVTLKCQRLLFCCIVDFGHSVNSHCSQSEMISVSLK